MDKTKIENTLTCFRLLKKITKVENIQDIKYKQQNTEQDTRTKSNKTINSAARYVVLYNIKYNPNNNPKQEKYNKKNIIIKKTKKTKKNK